MNKTTRQTAAGVMASLLLVLSGWIFWKKSSRAPSIESPAQLSTHDWKRALLETKKAFGNKNLSVFAAGVAYFSTLSFFPMLAAVVAIAAFIITPEQLQGIAHGLETYLPTDIASLVTTQLQNLAGTKADNIIAAIIAIALSLYGASAAISNLITATNVAYAEHESRGFIRLRLTSLVFTLGYILVGFALAGLLVLNGTTLEGLGLTPLLAAVLLAARWLLLVAIVTMGLAVFYRYGPDRKNPKWQWVSWGAFFATAIWLIGTTLFFIYAQNFANYSSSYSLFAGIIVLMIWLNLSAFIVLLGAEVNHKLESQSVQSTDS